MLSEAKRKIKKTKTSIQNKFRTPQEIQAAQIKENTAKKYGKTQISLEILLSKNEFETFYNINYNICISFLVTFFLLVNRDKKGDILSYIVQNEKFYESYINYLSDYYNANKTTIINAIQKFSNYEVFKQEFFVFIQHLNSLPDSKNKKLYQQLFQQLKEFHEEKLGIFQGNYYLINSSLNRNEFFQKFSTELHAIAKSRNVADKAKYYIQLSPAEIFTLTANTLIDLLMIAIAIVLPPVGVGGYAASIAANAASQAATAGAIAGGALASNFVGLLFLKGKEILSGDSYKVLRSIIPIELLPENDINRNNVLISSKLVASHSFNSKYQVNSVMSSFELDLLEMKKVKEIVEDVKKSIAKNGQYKFNISTLFTYYVNLIESVEKFKNKNTSQHALKNDYMKLINYYRYTLLLKQPLYIQLETLRLSLFKSLSVFSNNSSSFSDFKRKHLHKNLTNQNAIRKTIKRYVKNKDENYRNSFVDLVHNTLILGEMNQKETEKYLHILKQDTRIPNKLRDTLFGPPSNAPDSIADPLNRGLKGLSPLLFPNINNPVSLSSKDVATGVGLSVSLGCLIIFEIISSIISKATGLTGQERYTSLCSVLGGSYHAFKVMQAGTGVVMITNNFSHFIKDSLVNNILTNYAVMPLKIIGTFGVAFVAAKIDQHQDKYWKQLIEKYIAQQAGNSKEKNLENNKEYSFRPAYDFYKTERGFAPTRYMKAISELQDKRLDNISNLIRKIDLNILELMKLCQKYNNKEQNYEIEKRKIDHFISYLESIDNESQQDKLHDGNEHYDQNDIEKIVSLYTKIFIKLMSVAVEIQKFDDYMQYFVDGFLNEVDLALNLYMPLLKIDNSKVSDVINFASSNKNFQNF
ncbi:hypothetical protein QEJ31_03155 [Pigmentibacter sp. JX0631]|uniref:hypothetical protein n=1 Tax=Pigmentibacter sp. JX0631 TaxID=2976982 RepID=UPI00246914F6|nr:hypothetical protein [Pigmentibacter sp. JX0631]WGL60599.1 hypothetical protein QEJ31_03155 [Pigmentibacter sp. JX0631]